MDPVLQDNRRAIGITPLLWVVTFTVRGTELPTAKIPVPAVSVVVVAVCATDRLTQAARRASERRDGPLAF